MKRFCKNIFIYSLIFFFAAQVLFAEDLVIPVLKAPYQFENIQWDKSGDNFSYEVNGRTFIRDSLSLLLNDTYANNKESNISAFYKNPSVVEYPQVKIEPHGNSVTIYTKKSAGSPVNTKTVSNLPVEIKSAAINNLQSHLAFIGNDNQAYIYAINGNQVVSKVKCNPKSDEIYFTNSNQVVFSDTDKTAGLFSISGQKIKTFTNANSIQGLSLSPDQETLVLYEDEGNLNFYNTDSASQIGYIPNLGSKNISSVKLSSDSRKFLITGENNSLYIGNVKDFLFSPNTTAPETKQFQLAYNALDPNNKQEDVVKEFSFQDVESTSVENQAEFIESTKEKAKEKQKFELEEELKGTEPVQLASQTQNRTFPSTTSPSDRQITFKDERGRVVEMHTPSNVTSSDYQGDYETSPSAETNTVIVIENNSSRNTSSSTSGRTTYSNTGSSQGSGGSSSGSGSSSQGSESSGTSVTSGSATSGSGKYSNGLSSGSSGTGAGSSGTGASGAGETSNGGEKAAASEKADKNKNKKEKTEKEQKEKKSLGQKLKEIHDSEDESVNLKYKDGHGLIINAGAGFLPDPFIFDIAVQVGYRNYKLLKPFYFGGTLEPYLGISRSDFPYNYSYQGYYLGAPKMCGARIYSPFGFCMFPLSNKFEVYGEIDLGASINLIWSGQVFPVSVASNVFPAFYGAFKIGAAWDIFNLSVCGTYDGITGFSFRVETGVIIRLGKKKNQSL